MFPHRKYGQLEFAGESWRWIAVAHTVGACDPGTRTSRIQWVVCFRQVDECDRRVSCVLPRGSGQWLTDRKLLNFLKEVGSVQAGTPRDAGTTEGSNAHHRREH